MPTKRSTGTAAGAGDARRAPGLERERKQLREVEESVQQPAVEPEHGSPRLGRAQRTRGAAAGEEGTHRDAARR